MSCLRVFDWHKKFTGGREEVKPTNVLAVRQNVEFFIFRGYPSSQFCNKNENALQKGHASSIETRGNKKKQCLDNITDGIGPTIEPFSRNV
ncbi:hypothetical protein CEXT_390291 [Caerostris extrusa]|uniref:Uncharacterized protein n=1 Tax=Caerostris extrusa TaxID=172846 RepID=A0AAV4NV74_CAEEX|nr:hypothetical protein CEXT_390291 [Caerostris extrusa]